MALFDNKDTEKENDDSSDNLDELILSLGSNDWKVRENAAIRLTEAGKPAILPLLKSLDSDNSLIQTGAAEVLGTYGEAALPTLLRLVTTGKERVRDGAARAIGQNGDNALIILKKALSDEDYRARRGAVLSLGYLGYLGPEITGLLVGALEDKNEKVRSQAVLSLENINWQPKSHNQMALFYNAKGDLESLAKMGKLSLPFFEKEISGNNSEKKEKIASILPKINDDKALLLLISILGDKENSVRQKAVEAIGNSGNKKLQPYLVKALDDSDSYVRMEAVWALDKTLWKPSNNTEKAKYLITKQKWTDLLQMRETAVPVLIDSLKDKNPAMRLKSTEILRAMGNIGYAAINEALKSEDKELKTAAAEAAALIKKKNSESAEPKTGKKQKTPDEEVEEQIKRQKASMANKSSSTEEYWANLMRKNGLDEERILRLSKALSDPNEIIRAAAVENLKNAGEAGTECMLILLSDQKNNVKIAAIESLGDMRVKKAAPHLLKLTLDKNENVRMASVHSLGQIGEIRTLPGLIKLFSDKSPGVRTEASESVAKFGNVALPLLKNTFLEQDIIVRMTALRTVGMISDYGSISLCIRMLNDSEYDVRESAVSSLKVLSETLFNSLMDESQRILIQGTFMEKVGIIAALSGIDDLRAKQAIKNFESDDNDEVKKRAHQVLTGTATGTKVVPKQVIAKIKDNKNASEKISEEIKSIISDLKNQNNTVQMKAAEKVFLIGEDMINPLIEALNDKDPAYQNFIAEILIGLGDRAIEGLIKALKTGTPAVKMTAAQNLGKIPEKITIDALCESLYQEPDPLVRKVAAESLGFMGDHRSVDALIYAANEENNQVKGAAIRSLAYIGDKKAIEPIIAALKNEDPYISTVTTEALRSYGEDAIDTLVSALKTKNNPSKEKIAGVLDELNWVPETEESLSYYLIAKKNWNELENVGKAAIGPLSEAYLDDDIDTRISAINIIAKIGGEDAILPLAKALCDKSMIVRKNAENAIMKIGRAAIPALEKIVADARDPTERTFTMSLIRRLEV